MRVLVVSSTCSKEYYDKIYKKRYKPLLDTNQKFFLSLIEGLEKIKNIRVDCISTIPISSGTYPDRVIPSTKEKVGDVEFLYCGCLNLPVMRNLSNAFEVKRKVAEYLKQHKNEKMIIICDALLAEVSVNVAMMKRKNTKVLAVVTDVPSIVDKMNFYCNIKSVLSNFYGKIAMQSLYKYDKYIFLTEQMNELCNPNYQPYMIMECIVTPSNFIPEHGLESKNKPYVLYAGKFYRECGVLTLAKAAHLLKDVCEVWLYGGHGDCMEELRQLSEQIDNLKLHDIVPVEEIHIIETGAAALINPRPASEEFTKYSFPSKTAEYMLSGVPVIMYKLPGIPAEYDKYLHYIENESVEGIAKAVKSLFSENVDQRNSQALAARQFIIKNKNNKNQAERVLSFALSK